jgi:hypothetical protein
MTGKNAHILADSNVMWQLKDTQFQYIREVLLRLTKDCAIEHWLQVNGVNDLDAILSLSHTHIAAIIHIVPDPDDNT